jgi:pimeloyl-ACP methyl ester carboxylesterase
MANFLLVHGAWMDQRCWSQSAASLRDKSHTVVTFDLAGHGTDATGLADVSLARYVEQTLQKAASLGAGKVVLVGHSMGGIVISQAAEEEPERFSRLVYVAAYLPTSGQSLNDLAQTDANSRIGPNMRPAPDWSTLDIAEEARADLFFHDVDPVRAEPFLSAWKAEPVAPLGTPLTLTRERFGSVPRTYIHTTLDRVVSSPLQKRMLQATPADVFDLVCGHAAMLSKPRELAELLSKAA